MTQSLDAIREALTNIAGGHFDNASTLAINGQWHEAYGELQKIAKAALEAASLSDQSAGDGWKIVPVESTEAMVNAAPTLSSSARIKDIYRAMIAAAPASPIPVDRRAVLDECAKLAESFPHQVLCMWGRPGGPPGNGYRSSNGQDIAAAIRALAASPSLANEEKP